MRPYAAILSMRFRALLQYRAAAVAGFGTQLFWGLIRMMIFLAFYENSSAKTPMNVEQVVAYVWLGQAFLLLIPFRSDQELEQLIRTGNVAYELLRPVDLFNFWYSRAIATRFAPTMLRSIPLLIIATLAGWIHWGGLPSIAAGIAALAAATLLSAAISTIMTITIFWTISGKGINSLLTTLSYFFSGLIVPLPLFPDFLQPLLNFLPFRGLGDVPFRLLIGQMPAGELPMLLAHQLGWTIALVLFGRWLLRRAMAKLIIQGG